MFAIDDNWGSTEETPYPMLPAKKNASKTVQKRRLKAAKKVMNLSATAVLPAAIKEGVTAGDAAGPCRVPSIGASDAINQSKKKRRRAGKGEVNAAREQNGNTEMQPENEDAHMQRRSLAPDGELPPYETAAKKVNRKRKAGGENAELADLGTAEEGFRPPAAEKELSSKRETRPENPGSSPVEIPQSGDENRGEQGGAGSKRNFHTSGLLDQMTARLSGSKFRWLNEELYTSTGEDAFKLMQGQPELFQQYHEGFRQQTKNWPEQPLEAAIRWLKKQPKKLKVADFGCGDAGLAKGVAQKVVSLDLVAASPEVTACDMSSTPLGSESMDVVVFCLALMGTDYPSFLREATRVLKSGGKLWIAEVRSRFVHNGRESFQPFLDATQGLGYRLTGQDISNRMFVVFELQKTKAAGSQSQPNWPDLKPCLYKRR